MQQIDIEFQSLGATLRGWLYKPDENGPHSAVVMAHGFTATRTMTIDKYAEAIAAAGFAALVYDHRGLGASEGEPRQETNPFIQARGYRDAISFMSQRDDIATEQIGIWGDSMSANVAILAASMDERVAAVISQIPGCGPTMSSEDPDNAMFDSIKEAFLSADLLSLPVQRSEPMPVVSFDPIRHPCHLTPLTAYRWFIEHGGRLGSGWINDATRATPDLSVPYHPGLCAPHVKAPVLMMISPEDEIPNANPAVSRAVYELLPEPKELVEIPGGHFGLLWHPSELFDRAAAAQIDFLRRWL